MGINFENKKIVLFQIQAKLNHLHFGYNMLYFNQLSVKKIVKS